MFLSILMLYRLIKQDENEMVFPLITSKYDDL